MLLKEFQNLQPQSLPIFRFCEAQLLPTVAMQNAPSSKRINRMAFIFYSTKITGHMQFIPFQYLYEFNQSRFRDTVSLDLTKQLLYKHLPLNFS